MKNNYYKIEELIEYKESIRTPYTQCEIVNGAREKDNVIAWKDEINKEYYSVLAFYDEIIEQGRYLKIDLRSLKACGDKELNFNIQLSQDLIDKYKGFIDNKVGKAQLLSTDLIYINFTNGILSLSLQTEKENITLDTKQAGNLGDIVGICIEDSRIKIYVDDRLIWNITNNYYDYKYENLKLSLYAFGRDSFDLVMGCLKVCYEHEVVYLKPISVDGNYSSIEMNVECVGEVGLEAFIDDRWVNVNEVRSVDCGKLVMRALKCGRSELRGIGCWSR